MSAYERNLETSRTVSGVWVKAGHWASSTVHAFRRFLACKMLPESQVSYDWQSDTYTLTTPARFADRMYAAMLWGGRR